MGVNLTFRSTERYTQFDDRDKRKSQLGVQHTVQSSVAKTFGDFSCKEFYNKIHCTVFSGQWVLTCQTLALTVKWPTEPVDTDVTGRQRFFTTVSVPLQAQEIRHIKMLSVKRKCSRCLECKFYSRHHQNNSK